jgi:flagellar motor switch protein FliM
VTLHGSVDSPMKVYVNGEAKFIARPGVLGSKLAARILDAIPLDEPPLLPESADEFDPLEVA